MPKDKPEKEESKITVTVISRKEITTYPKINTPVKLTLVTYVGGGLPPHMIKIPTESYSIEAEKAAIKADIERRIKEMPEVYEI